MKEIGTFGTLRHRFQRCSLMNGTPLQNNMQELWTLLNFIVKCFQQHISLFMLRRI